MTDWSSISSMNFFRTYHKGLILGFLFGTVGVFLLALLSLIHPIFEITVSPLLWPGRFFASILAGSSASTPIVIVLYLCTGVFYAIIGLLLQIIARSAHHKEKV